MPKKTTAFDLAKRTEQAIRELKRSGVDTSAVYVWLPDGNGWFTQKGPMPVEEAATLCKDFYGG